MNAVLIDVSELLAHPLRTGIQRVERELIRHWPGPAPLAPCVFDAASAGLVRLPESTLASLLATGLAAGLGNGAGASGPEGAELAAARAQAAPLGGDMAARVVFNPELFYDRERADFYRRLCRGGARRVSWLLYDLLPWLAPRFFHDRPGFHGMDFLRALREVPRVAFISEETRADYRRAVMRDGAHDGARDGPVFALGGDGLGLPRQKFDPARRTFVVLGTIEPRKNVAAILAAFQALWATGVAAPLVLLGRMIETSARERALLASLAGAPLFTFIEQADEASLRATLARARALVTASLAEGFGLPPFEALAAGIPVIVPQDMPSIRLLPPLGQVRLAATDPPAIAAAVRMLCDDATAARYWAEAARLAIPTWKDFSRGLADWLQQA